MFTDTQKAKICKFAEERPIKLVYLFGSQAKGSVTPLSDYDFAVLFDENLSSEARFDLRLEFLAFLTGFLKTDKVDVVDLSNAPPALRYEAVSARGEIYVKNDTERVAFEVKTLQEYFDMAYYLKRHTNASLGTIAREGF